MRVAEIVHVRAVVSAVSEPVRKGAGLREQVGASCARLAGMKDGVEDGRGRPVDRAAGRASEFENGGQRGVFGSRPEKCTEYVFNGYVDRSPARESDGVSRRQVITEKVPCGRENISSRGARQFTQVVQDAAREVGYGRKLSKTFGGTIQEGTIQSHENDVVSTRVIL